MSVITKNIAIIANDADTEREFIQELGKYAMRVCGKTMRFATNLGYIIVNFVEPTTQADAYIALFDDYEELRQHLAPKPVIYGRDLSVLTDIYEKLGYKGLVFIK
jgi:hypothetical protein